MAAPHQIAIVTGYHRQVQTLRQFLGYSNNPNQEKIAGSMLNTTRPMVALSRQAKLYSLLLDEFEPTQVHPPRLDFLQTYRLMDTHVNFSFFNNKLS
jgi:hypothetical protein